MAQRLGSFVVRRRRAVIITWVLLLVVGATIGSSAFSVLSSEFGAGGATESGQVAERLDDLAGTGGEIAIIVDGVDVDDPAVADTRGRRPRADRGPRRRRRRHRLLDAPISMRCAPPTVGPPLPSITLTGGLDEEAELELAHEVEDLARDIDAPAVLVGGNLLVGEQFETASERDLLRGEAIALPIAIIAMFFILGGAVAAGMPLLVAFAGVVMSLALLVGATMIGDVSIFSVNVVNMLGIGLGIDYGLLMVNRFREERGHGRDVHDAVAQTVATAGTTVMFSALTVAVAMSGLFVFGIPLLTSFGIAGLGVVLLCMAAAVTLLPATLAVVGRRIKPLQPVEDSEGRFYRLARWVQRRPLIVGTAVVAILIALAIPFLDATFENGDARTLPRSSEVREVALVLGDRFPARGTDPVTVIADTDADSPAFQQWLAAQERLPQVAGVSVRPGSPADISVVDIVPIGTSQGPDATAIVETVRAETPGFPIQVGGQAAELADVKDILRDRLPLGGAAHRARDVGPAVHDDRIGRGADQGGGHEHPEPRAPASERWSGSSRTGTCRAHSRSTRSAHWTCGCPS